MLFKLVQFFSLEWKRDVIQDGHFGDSVYLFWFFTPDLFLPLDGGFFPTGHTQEMGMASQAESKKP